MIADKATLELLQGMKGIIPEMEYKVTETGHLWVDPVAAGAIVAFSLQAEIDSNKETTIRIKVASCIGAIPIKERKNATETLVAFCNDEPNTRTDVSEMAYMIALAICNGWDPSL